ncbi:methyl-accepting chemotaxis protein [soil metagenome]
MLDKLRFGHKIATLVGISIAGLMAITAASALQLRSEIMGGRQAVLRGALQSATNIVLGYQAKVAAGTMKLEDAQKAAKDAVRLSRYNGPEGKSDYFYIFTLAGSGVMHPLKPDWEGQDMVGKIKDGKGMDIIVAMMQGLRASPNGVAAVDTEFPRPGQTQPVPKLQMVMAVPGWDWMVGSGLYTDDVAAEVRAAVVRQLALGLAVLLVIGGVAWTVSRSVMKQLGGEPTEVIRIMSEVADGNLGTHIPPAPADSLMDGLRRMVASVRSTIVQVRSATDGISTASAEIAIGNHDLSVRTEQTASNLQQAASSVEQLTGTVKQSADSARQANQLASSAAEVAARGGVVVSQVVSTMDDINASSKKIADIISVIDGIAFQTNILALNAAVEAARAGEQGRGFAVVASEVRSLAQRSAQAAKEIKVLISASVDNVAGGAKLVADAGRTMNEIVTSVKRVSDIIGEISAAATEQSSGIDQVNTSVGELDQMTQQNAALVEESAAAAESLKHQAGSLAQVVATFRLGEERAGV